MGLKNFVEEHNSDQVEPTAKGCAQFDWDEVERAFGESPLTDDERHRLSLAMAFVLDWLMSVDLDSNHALKGIGKRTIAMAWVLDPGRFGSKNKNIEASDSSLRTLARKLGFSAPNISPLTAEFSRLTKIFNQFQDHDWKKKKQQHEDNITNAEQIEEQ